MVFHYCHLYCDLRNPEFPDLSSHLILRRFHTAACLWFIQPDIRKMVYRCTEGLDGRDYYGSAIFVGSLFITEKKSETLVALYRDSFNSVFHFGNFDCTDMDRSAFQQIW